ncbi:MAG: nucleoid occlusion protein [Erysipelotrichaceae bacterium]|nr:nucleoid occlusion protein [Erysipelotrichaceae bacterium]MBR0474042.1 nucleoid occlusion protein [Erysipelotrichaceae bacterium]
MAFTELLRTERIVPNPYQPRKQFDTEALQELTASIRENGLIQPVTVRKNGDHFELIAGERRFRACQLLGWETIPAVIIEADDDEMAQLALIENIQREDLSAIEEANAYQELLSRGHITQEQLADKMGKSQSSIANKLRLLNLSEEVKQALVSHQISERHGRAMLGLSNEQQKRVLTHITENDLTVKDTEKYIKNHYTLNPGRRNDNIKCFGVSTRIAINTIHQAINSLKKVNMDIGVSEQDNAEDYVITISIKK